jgi:hypothetical protein
MPSPKSAAVKQDQLNRAMPAARDAALGDVVADLIATANALRADLTEMRTRINAVLAKLDADAGVTDTNYAATQAMPALTAAAVTTLADR